MSELVFHSDPEILGGTPVFVGTRVPLKNLIDYLEKGHTLDDFIDDFPSVSREQTIAALELARELLITNEDLLPLVPSLLQVISEIQPGQLKRVSN